MHHLSPPWSKMKVETLTHRRCCWNTAGAGRSGGSVNKGSCCSAGEGLDPGSGAPADKIPQVHKTMQPGESEHPHFTDEELRVRAVSLGYLHGLGALRGLTLPNFLVSMSLCDPLPPATSLWPSRGPQMCHTLTCISFVSFAPMVPLLPHARPLGPDLNVTSRAPSRLPVLGKGPILSSLGLAPHLGACHRFPSSEKAGTCAHGSDPSTQHRQERMPWPPCDRAGFKPRCF